MPDDQSSRVAPVRHLAGRFRPILLYTLVGVSLSGLTVATATAARTWRSERAARARALYQEGVSLVRSGRAVEALEAFRVALELEHDTTEYQRTLATTLAGLGRRNEARAYLGSLLAQDPTDGPANFLMARIADAESHFVEARRYYQRAVYGAWTPGESDERLEARVAFVEFLHRTASRSELVAELLRLNADLPPADSRRHRVGRLLLEAGAAREAGEVFRELTKLDPRDGEAWAGLASAEAADQRYVQAREAARRAVQLAPDRADFAAALARAEAVLALTPSGRGLSRAERQARARRLFEVAVGAWTRCPGTPEMLTEQTRALLAAAAAPARRRRTADVAEPAALLGAAEELWQGRRMPCPAGSPDEEAAAVLLRGDAGQ